MTLTRVDETLNGDRRRGLDALLERAPVGIASWHEIGWVARTAPVHKLKLFRLADADGHDLFSIAPNIDIAPSVWSRSSLRWAGRSHSPVKPASNWCSGSGQGASVQGQPVTSASG